MRPKLSQLLRVVHTCHAWYYLFHNSKSTTAQGLWASCQLNTEIGAELLNMIVERSGNSLLDIEDRGGRMIDWCFKNLPRVQTLRLQFTHPSELIWISTAKGNNLKTLHIDGSKAHCSSQGIKMYLPRLCNGDTPSLKHLHLSGIRLPWAAGQYTHLVTLTIIVGSLKMDDDKDFHTIFSESPDLEEFIFHCEREQFVLVRSKDEDGDNLPVPKHRTPLRKLRRLDLYLRPVDIQHVLQGISTPKMTSVKIEAIVPRSKNYGTRKGVSLIPENHHCLQSLSTIQRLVINARDRTILGTGTTPGTFEFKTIPDSTYESSVRDGRGTNADTIFLDTMSWLLGNAVSPSCLNEIVFEDHSKIKGQSLLDAERVIHCLRRFDQLRQLTFDTCSDDFVKILAREGKSMASPNSLELSALRFHSMRSTAPSLRELTLNHSNLGNKVTLHLRDFQLVSESEKDAQELMNLLQTSKCLGPHSTITARWGNCDHSVYYITGIGAESGRWKIEGSG